MIATLNTVEEKGGHVLLIFSYITLWVERRPPPPLSMSISCDRAARGELFDGIKVARRR
jgi:hypothetical protein